MSVVWLRVCWIHLPQWTECDEEHGHILLLLGEQDPIKMAIQHKPPTLCIGHMAYVLPCVQILLNLLPQLP